MQGRTQDHRHGGEKATGCSRAACSRFWPGRNVDKERQTMTRDNNRQAMNTASSTGQVVIRLMGPGLKGSQAPLQCGPKLLIPAVESVPVPIHSIGYCHVKKRHTLLSVCGFKLFSLDEISGCRNCTGKSRSGICGKPGGWPGACTW